MASVPSPVTFYMVSKGPKERMSAAVELTVGYRTSAEC